MKNRKRREAGGVNLAADDLRDRPMEYTKDSNVNREALERKRGGKSVGKAMGDKAKMNVGRKPRKSGGRLATADWSAAQTSTGGRKP
jgi:hypothetical protein